MRTMRNAAIVAAVVCGLLTLAQQVAVAQYAELTQIANRLSERGYRSTHERIAGWLDDGASTTFSVWLQRGTVYSLHGTCDRDCTDLDLELTSPTGSVVSRDFLSDAIPVVSAMPGESGRYRVRVVMATCSVGPCQYAVGIFGR